jgi:hypothetical protein
MFVKNVRITHGAMGALKAEGNYGVDLVARHQNGDWGVRHEK